MTSMAMHKPSHFLWRMDGAVAVIQLNRPERKNPLTFESYAELRDTFRALPYADDIHAVVFLPNGGNFCSGGDVHEIIGPLVKMTMKELLAFTRMTGDLVKAMRHCAQPIVSAVDGICARRRRDHRHGVRPAHRHARGARPPSCSTASGLPAATWAPARCCRASSARAAPPNCSTPAAP